jgi:hypothetical protein
MRGCSQIRRRAGGGAGKLSPRGDSFSKQSLSKAHAVLAFPEWADEGPALGLELLSGWRALVRGQFWPLRGSATRVFWGGARHPVWTGGPVPGPRPGPGEGNPKPFTFCKPAPTRLPRKV